MCGEVDVEHRPPLRQRPIPVRLPLLREERGRRETESVAGRDPAEHGAELVGVLEQIAHHAAGGDDRGERAPRLREFERLEAELADRDMNLKEAKLRLEQMDAMMESMRKGAEFGLQLDLTEAQIAGEYAKAFKALWEIGMAGDNPVATIQDIETALIDKRATNSPPQPLPSPNPNPVGNSPQ